jgi:protein tyrosine/serine phosphatase
MSIISPTFRRLGIAVAIVTLTPIVASAVYLGVQYMQGNFHEVVPGQLYRSGQLSAEQFHEYVTHYHIRSIVNLRGSNEQAAWYRAEVAEARSLSVAHVDFAMSASRETPIDKVDALEAILRDVAKPVLIHCQAGSDRSGLAAAVFMHRIRGVEIEQAEGQVSLFYGHIGVPFLSRAYPIDETWEKLEDIYREREREAHL